MAIGKQERELEVFAKFAEVAGLLPGASFESRTPPEPDILCIARDLSKHAYELVEILDQSFAGVVNRQLDTKAACAQYLADLPAAQGDAFRLKYFNADIFIAFKQGLSLRRRKNALPAIFERLIALPAESSGKFFTNDQALAPCIDYALVHRARFNGPLFDAPAISWIGDPTVDAIAGKMTKSYRPQGALSLLAYIQGNPMLPDEVWLAHLDDYFETLDGACQFECVFVFDCGRNKIMRTWQR